MTGERTHPPPSRSFGLHVAYSVKLRYLNELGVFILLGVSKFLVSKLLRVLLKL